MGDGLQPFQNVDVSPPVTVLAQYVNPSVEIQPAHGLCISLQQVLSVVHSHKKMLLYISLVVVDCGDPGQPENGMKWLRSTTLGSYVKYKCFEGYKLKGYGYRKCLSDGQWSRSLPTCEGVSLNRPSKVFLSFDLNCELFFLHYM